MELEFRYSKIRQTVESLSDFPVAELAKSRDLFNLDGEEVTPRCFEVWTCLAGLPIPVILTRRLQEIVAQVKTLLPADVRFYQVIPKNYHWELFIIKRQTEQVPPNQLQEAGEIFKEILSHQRPFNLSYRGFLVTPDGTVVAQGYGEFDSLRELLRNSIPFASLQQSQLGHISLGRILDCLGHDQFSQMKKMVRDSQNELYGEFPITEFKYVYERQWYMEDREIVATLPLQQFSIE